MQQRFLVLLLALSASIGMEGRAQDNGHLEGNARAIQGPFFPCTLTTNRIQAVVSESNTLRSRLESLNATQRLGGKATANFEVTYTGFTPEAEAAFQYAVDLWAASIASSVTIRVDAKFKDLGAGNILGQAGPNRIHANFPGAPEQDVWYLDALADALGSTDNNSGQPDINAEFNSSFDNWYFGLDGEPQSGQWDFVTVVLHELGHGLGFLGSANFEADIGSWGIEPSNGQDPLPIIYDLPVEDLGGTRLLDEVTYPNPSMELGDLLQSNDLHLNSPSVLAASDGNRAKLYAPASWEQASSYSHWDEATYPPDTTGFALMTPAISNGEAYHEVDALTCGLFEDMGWVLGPGCGGNPPPSPPSTQELAVGFEGPNPVRTTTIVRVQQSEAGPVRAALYDVLGRQVMTLHDGEAPTILPLLVNREGLAAGMYLLDIRAEGGHETLRITFL